MFSVSVKDLGKVRKRLDDLDLATNTQDVLDEAGAYLLFRIKERFLNQEAPDGSRWKESQAAKKRKAKGRDGGTLFDTGSLFHGITLARSGKNVRRIYDSTDYGRYHHFGEGQEERPFLDFNSDDEAGITAIIEARIRDAIK